MKIKILLSTLICFFLFFSCKKEKKSDPLSIIKRQIIGVWDLKENKTVAYDAGSKEPKSEYGDVSNHPTFEFIDETHLKISEINVLLYDYTLKLENNKTIITFNNDDFELTINNGTMIWVTERNYDRPDYSKFINIKSNVF